MCFLRALYLVPYWQWADRSSSPSCLFNKLHCQVCYRCKIKGKGRLISICYVKKSQQSDPMDMTYTRLTSYIQTAYSLIFIRWMCFVIESVWYLWPIYSSTLLNSDFQVPYTYINKCINIVTSYFADVPMCCQSDINVGKPVCVKTAHQSQSNTFLTLFIGHPTEKSQILKTGRKKKVNIIPDNQSTPNLLLIVTLQITRSIRATDPQ